MDFAEIEKKIKEHKVKKSKDEYDFDSFNALCRFLDIEPVKSKGQRDALEKQFRRFFDYKKLEHSNKIKITGTHYSKPLPYVTARTGKHWNDVTFYIANLIMINDSLLAGEHTKTDILNSIGLYSPDLHLPNDSRIKVYQSYISKLYSSLDSVFTQLRKHDMAIIEDYFGFRLTKTRYKKLSKAQETKYKAIYSKTCSDFDIDNSWEAFATGQSEEFFSELNKEVAKAFSGKQIYHVYKIRYKRGYSKAKCLSDLYDYFSAIQPELDKAKAAGEYEGLMKYILVETVLTNLAPRIIKIGGIGIASEESYEDNYGAIVDTVVDSICEKLKL